MDLKPHLDQILDVKYTTGSGDKERRKKKRKEKFRDQVRREVKLMQVARVHLEILFDQN